MFIGVGRLPSGWLCVAKLAVTLPGVPGCTAGRQHYAIYPVSELQSPPWLPWSLHQYGSCVPHIDELGCRWW